MTSGDVLTLPLAELVSLARNSLKEKDLQSLQDLDRAFHDRFYRQVTEGSEARREELIGAILAVVESPEAREVPPPDAAQRYLGRWQHLDLILDALRHDADVLEHAERLLLSRAHGRRLLDLVAAFGEPGITAGDLAQQLGIHLSQLSKLLREFDADNLIERRQAGRHVYVSLGVAGEILAERRGLRPYPGPPELPAREDLRGFTPMERPLDSARQTEPEPVPEDPPICELVEPEPVRPARKPVPAKPVSTNFKVPPTTLLDPPQGRNPYDEEELKQTAVQIRAKFQEFNILGGLVQINPGPVVTTFEYKPEAGVKYSRITNLAEDLCLGLQAESILIERIPGKSTVGIEVPNKRREVISLREILESSEFQDSPSRLTLALGKDINGRIRTANLDSMPHLLIAGSTGSGKSVLMNCLIMSVLYKATPDEVRFIMVDPKRLELGLYEDVPHLLTPVITDIQKAACALRNATLEMERRLKLLATQGVRNVEQYNKKIRSQGYRELSLFDQEEAAEAPPQPLPYIIILVDELADLMLLEGNNVEESITRLAQTARAVGIHLVLATQRPSVDVITGLIKANFPARISFRVATRIDSRAILDSMGAEALLRRGDMLFLPPGSGRMIRVHGPYVSESEITQVVEFWKNQSTARYENSYLAAPPKEEREGEEAADQTPGEEDHMYEHAVRVVLDTGKASTSLLQRRLKLGYGRAARILDAMEREGIISPPDGPRPREVLKRPDWLLEVDNALR